MLTNFNSEDLSLLRAIIAREKQRLQSSPAVTMGDEGLPAPEVYAAYNPPPTLVYQTVQMVDGVWEDADPSFVSTVDLVDLSGTDTRVLLREKFGSWVLLPAPPDIGRWTDPGIDEFYSQPSLIRFNIHSGFDITSLGGLPIVSVLGVGVESNQHTGGGIVTGDKQQINGVKCFINYARMGGIDFARGYAADDDLNNPYIRVTTAASGAAAFIYTTFIPIDSASGTGTTLPKTVTLKETTAHNSGTGETDYTKTWHLNDYHVNVPIVELYMTYFSSGRIDCGFSMQGKSAGGGFVGAGFSVVDGVATFSPSPPVDISDVTGLGTGVATFLGTPTSANLAAALTDETGSGKAVFDTSPTLVTPNIGVATATSVNKITITAPTTSATLTIADGKTFTASNTITLTATDGATLAIGGGGTLGSAAYTSSSAYQAVDTTLTSLAAADWSANSLPIGSGTDTVAQVTFGANTFPARASTGNLVAKTITDFALSILDDATAADVRATIGAGTGTGDVVGPSSVTDAALAAFDGTTGKLLKNTNVTLTPGGAVRVTVTDTANSAAADAMFFEHKLSSGTAAAGMGHDVHFHTVSDAGTLRQQAQLRTSWVSAADLSYKARAVWFVSDASGDRECLRMEATGSAAAIGVLGATAAVRQTGDMGTAMVTFGWMSGTPTFDAANLTGTVANGRLDAELQAIAGLTSAANRIPYFTGSGTAALLTFDTDTTLSAASATAVPSQSAVKSYVDNLLTGLAWKQKVRVATTANGALATAYENGDVIDGVTLATGDRILLKNQTTQTENGIYVVAASGAPTRATDADAGSELVNATCLVSEGTANADTAWTCTNNSVTIGSTNIAFVQITGAGVQTADESTLHLSGNVYSIISTYVGQTSIVTLGTVTTGTWHGVKIEAAYGGTNVDSSAWAQGDLVYISATGTWNHLAKNTTATRYLANTGTSNNPAWAPVDLTNGVTGTLPVSSGGTGLATLTAHALYVGNGTSAPTALAVGTDGQLLLGQSTADPAWKTSSGDVTIDKNGVTTIGAGKVVASMLGVLNAFTNATPACPDRIPFYDDSAAANRDMAVSDLLSMAKGYMYGYGLANNGSDANNDIDVAAGVCADSTNVTWLVGSALTKRMDAAWAAGNNQGGMDTGSEAASTWYHVHAILKDSDQSVDYLFSTSATAPTMPTGYTYFRRLGSVYNDGSSNLKAFHQDGDWFEWDTPIQDVSATNPGTSAVTRTLSVPSGVRTRALLYVQFDATSVASNPATIIISDLSTVDVAPSAGTAGVLLFSSTAILNNAGNYLECWTNTSSQVRSRLQTSAAATVLRMITQGWMDPRGRV